jgi:hypothetical protein
MVPPYFHCPIVTWGPVVEQNYGQERFLTGEPNELFQQGRFSKVNILTGITADEFMLPIAGEFLSYVETADLGSGVFFSVYPCRVGRVFGFPG